VLSRHNISIVRYIHIPVLHMAHAPSLARPYSRYPPCTSPSTHPFSPPPPPTPLHPPTPHPHPPQASDLYRILDKSAVGDKLDVEVLRGDATQHLPVVLDSSEVVPLTEPKPEGQELKPELKPVPLPDGVPPEPQPSKP
jgi:hypothetical protein